MVNKDFHSKPFDEGTKIKLEIFQKYTEEWLPVFLTQNSFKKIFIYDFFSGSGMDSNGTFGSPLLILQELEKYNELIIRNNKTIYILFNDLDKNKIDFLKKEISLKFPETKASIRYFSEKFEDLFADIKQEFENTQNSPKLIFLDQFGIKYITTDVFKTLIETKLSDFLFYISSSFVRRFIELEEFQQYIKINSQKFEESRPFKSHQIVFEYYKGLVPPHLKYFLAPFSIKKNSNIYGIIFGSQHSLGIEKFLKICWNLNESTGDANYNIDEENIADGIMSLFPEENIPKKLKVFEQELTISLMNKSLKLLKTVYEFTLEFGCLPKHANEILKKMEKTGKIQKLVNKKNSKVHNVPFEKIKILE